MPRLFLTFITFVTVFSQLSPAQEDPNIPLLREALTKQTAHNSVQVNFRLTKKSPALKDEIKTDGKLWLVPDKSFRWQVGEPAAQTTLYDGEFVHSINHEANTSERISPDNRSVQPLLLILGFGKKASLKNIDDNFEISGTNKTGHRIAAALTPRNRHVRRAITNLHVQVNTKTNFLERISWTQKDGTTVLTQFLTPSLKLNQTLPENIFTP